TVGCARGPGRTAGAASSQTLRAAPVDRITNGHVFITELDAGARVRTRCGQATETGPIAGPDARPAWWDRSHHGHPRAGSGGLARSPGTPAASWAAPTPSSRR